jgi:hypothetical protein
MFLLTAGTLVGAEMAKEGSGPNATYFTSTSQVLAQGKGNGEFTRTYVKGPAEGISASISKSTASWKIP